MARDRVFGFACDENASGGHFDLPELHPGPDAFLNCAFHPGLPYKL